VTDPVSCPNCGTKLSAESAPEGLCPECLLRLGLPGAPEEDSAETLAPPTVDSGIPLVAPPAAPPERIGSYRIVRKLGEGGMGEIYEAEQVEPVRRKVALKLIKWGMDTRRVVARFEAERQALALMSHANIARVFDAGATERGRPYFVMEFVEGVPVTEYCDRQCLSTRQRLELFMQVCDGVQHAHHKGIIHRDIKPSNVLVALEDDRPVPKIIDFGVAKATEQRLTEKTVYTELGQLVGTPSYMSPEQADLTSQDIDTRTDVYALGVLLYELLSGALPLDLRALRQAGYEEMLRWIREEEPSKPSTRVSGLGEAAAAAARSRGTEAAALVRRLRGDLDWIAVKALEKDRARRYGSPAELAADVARHLHSEPVVACPPSATYRAKKFVRRHRFGVVAAGVVLAALVLGTIGTTIGMVRARAEARRAEAKTLLTLGRNLLEENPSGALAYAMSSLELVDDPGARRFIVRALSRGPTTFSERTEQDALNLEFSPNGAWLAGGGWHGMLKLWRRDGSPPVTLSGHGDELVWVQFSGDSKFLVSGTSKTIRVWSLPEAEVVWDREIRRGAAFVRGQHLLTLTDEEDGERVVLRRWPLAGGAPVLVRAYDVPVERGDEESPSMRRLRELLLGRKPSDVDPTGERWFYAEGTDLYALPVDALETAAPRRIGGGDARIVSVDCHPAGEWVATLDESFTVRLWSLDEKTERPLRTIDDLHRGKKDRDPGQASIRFDARGSWMALVDVAESAAFVWDLEAPPGTEPLVLRRGNQITFSLAVHPDGDWLAVGDYFTVSIWPLDRGYPRTLWRGGRVTSVVFGREGEWLIASSWDGTIRRWSLAGKRDAHGEVLFDSGGTAINHLCLSPDGSRLAAALWNGRVAVVSFAGEPPRELSGFVSPLWAVTFDRTGRRVAAGGGEKSEEEAFIRVWDLESGEVEVLDAGDGRMIGRLEFLEDGRLLAWNERAGLRVWDVEAGTHELLVSGGEVAFLGALSPDGRHVLGSRFDDPDGPVETFVYDLRDGGLRVLRSHGDLAFGLAWDPTGLDIVSGGLDGVIRVGSADGGEPHLLFGHEGFVGGAAVHPDGDRIASCGGDGTLRLWPMPRGEPFHTLPHDEFLARLRSLTNYRVVTDAESVTGYRIDYAPLPGWEERPIR
jgi:serine/threonine protein kinase/WD40 repeat protein